MHGHKATDQAAAEFDDTEVKCLLLGDENQRQRQAIAAAARKDNWSKACVEKRCFEEALVGKSSPGRSVRPPLT